MNRPASSPRTLRRIVLVSVTLLFAGSGQAQWVQLGRSDNFRVYLEQKSIQRNGDFAQIWQLMDFATAQWADAQTVVGSIKNLIEYDCARSRSRTLVGEAYSEQMAGGRMVASEPLPDPQWESVEPGTTAEKIRLIACGKR